MSYCLASEAKYLKNNTNQKDHNIRLLLISMNKGPKTIVIKKKLVVCQFFFSNY